MKRFLLLSALLTLVLGFSGCLAQCSIAPHTFNTENGPAVGSVLCENNYYRFLFFAPISAGEPWKAGRRKDWHRRIDWFTRHNLVSDNMKMVRLAQAELGGSRLGEIRTEVESSSAWSLFLVKREVFRTSAVILK